VIKLTLDDAQREVRGEYKFARVDHFLIWAKMSATDNSF
jgi:hypothetical protein